MLSATVIHSVTVLLINSPSYSSITMSNFWHVQWKKSSVYCQCTNILFHAKIHATFITNRNKKIAHICLLDPYLGCMSCAYVFVCHPDSYIYILELAEAFRHSHIIYHPQTLSSLKLMKLMLGWHSLFMCVCVWTALLADCSNV